MKPLPCLLAAAVLLLALPLPATSAPAHESWYECRMDGTVQRIEDGRTLLVRLQDGRVVNVLLAGIEVPPHSQPHAAQSRQRLEYICPRNAPVALHDADRRVPGHYIAQVYCRNRHAQKEMIRAGAAWTGDRTSALFQAQRDAWAARRGVWGIFPPPFCLKSQ